MQLITNRIPTGKPRRTLKEIVEDHLQKKAAASAPVVKTAAVVEPEVKVAEKEADEAPSSGQLDPEPLHQKGESVKPSATEKKDDVVKATVKENKTEKTEAPSSGQPEWEGEKKNNNMQDPKAEEDKKSDAKAEEKKPCQCGKAASVFKFIKISNLTDESERKAKMDEWKKVYPAEYVDLMFAKR